LRSYADEMDSNSVKVKNLNVPMRYCYVLTKLQQLWNGIYCAISTSFSLHTFMYNLGEMSSVLSSGLWKWRWRWNGVQWCWAESNIRLWATHKLSLYNTCFPAAGPSGLE